MNCARCNKNISTDDTYRRNCSHYFHYDCLKLVCDTTRECPLCCEDVHHPEYGYRVLRNTNQNRRPAIKF